MSDTIPDSSPLAKRLLGEGFAPSGETFIKGEALWWFAGKGNVELEIILGGSRGVVVCESQTCAWSTVKMAELGQYMATNTQSAWVSIIDDRFATNDVTLGWIMGLMHWFEATDPRDKVFAVLKLTSFKTPTANPPMADYSASIQNVYVGAARYYINQFEEIDLALQPQSKKVVPNLPSWVPDYSVTYDIYPSPLRGYKNFGEVIRGHPARARSPSLYIDGWLLDKIVFKVSIARKTDVYDVMQAAVQAMAKYGRELYDSYSTNDAGKYLPTDITGTNFEAVLITLFKSMGDVSPTPGTRQYRDTDITGGEDLEDRDWESSEADDAVIDSDVVSFIAWKLSMDHRTPDQSRDPPGYLNSPVGSWDIRSREKNDFDFSVYRRMETHLRWGWDLFYTEKGRFGLTRKGEAEEGMSIAILGKVPDLCLLREGKRDGRRESWYEFVDRVSINHTIRDIENLEDIYGSSKVERLEIR